MKLGKTILSILVLLLCVNTVMAVQITPAQADFNYAPGEVSTGSFKVLGEGDLGISVQGELKDYVQVYQPHDKGEWKEVKYEIRHPDILDKPGINSANIYVSEDKGIGGNAVAVAAVHHQINLDVPYPGKYLENKLLTIDDNDFIIKFTTFIDNKGSENLDLVENELNIYDASEKVATIYKAQASQSTYDVILGNTILGTTEPQILGLPKKTFSISSGDSVENQVKIKKLLLGDGEYLAESNVRFDGESATVTEPFEIGEPELTALRKTEHIRSSDVGRIDILVNSNWNTVLKGAYVIAEISKDGKILTQLESSGFDVRPNTNETVKLYWEAQNIDLGEYDVDVKTYYKDKVFEDSFTISAVDVLPARKITLPPVFNYALLSIVILTLVALFYRWYMHHY